MKYLACLLPLCLSLCIFQSVALADNDAVKIVPKSGEPMIVREFRVFRWSSDMNALWNQQKITVPVKKIKSIRFLGVTPDDVYDLKVEVTMKSGEKPVMRIRNESCYGQTQFGRLDMHLDEMRFLDLDPDPIPPRDAPPAPAPGQGANP